MAEATLLVLAAGMGSRFGGLKQIAPLGPNGEIIIDYSLYDAKEAGFTRVVFVVKPELLDTFREVVGVRASRLMEVDYALQDVHMTPEGFKLPEGREKPWGTGHAVLCARDKIKGPFAVINADDFYGRDTYKKLFGFLSKRAEPGKMCMVGFPLKNTLTENGTVSRGICSVSSGELKGVTERTGIKLREGLGISYEENGEAVAIDESSTASMNVWGFDASVFDGLHDAFDVFMAGLDEKGAEKAEFYLPAFVDGQIKSGKASVEVLSTESRWYGVTYQEDKQGVADALKAMYENKTYPNLRD